MIIEFWKTGENPITCYGSVKNKRQSVRVPKKRELKTPRPHKQPIVVKSTAGVKEYESVAICAAELEMQPSTIYAMLNGHQKNEGDYQFFKSKINQ